MELDASDVAQYQYDLIVVLTGLLVKSGALDRSDLIQTFEAVAERETGKKRQYFEMVAENFRSDPPRNPPTLQIVE